MSISKDFDAAISKYLRTATFPVSVKIYDSAKDFPERTKRPLRDLGHRINLCQGVAMARRYGWTIGFTEEDHACANSLILMGLKEVPDLIKNGSIVYPLYTEDLEHGAITQEVTPRSDRPLRAICVSPLQYEAFEPDVVLVYCNPGQCVRLIQASLYKTGGAMQSSSMGRCACATEIAVTLMKDECQVIIPGGGEKVFGALGDDEMVFAAPISKLRDLIDGLKGTHHAGAARIPSPYYGLRIEPEFPNTYRDLEMEFGIKSE